VEMNGNEGILRPNCVDDFVLEIHASWLVSSARLGLSWLPPREASRHIQNKILFYYVLFLYISMIIWWPKKNARTIRAPADRCLFRKVSNLTLWIPPVMRRVRKAGLCTEGQGAAGSSGSSVHPLLILPSQLLNIIGGWSWIKSQ
jgi:hypothetical protein